MSKKWEKELSTGWEPEFVISSGSLKLDLSKALSNYGGIPAGTMVQLASKTEGSFKTSLALAGAKEIQKLGYKVIYIDAEAGLTGLDWIEGMGIDTSEDAWLYAQPENGEEAFEIAEYFINHKDYKGIIIDSIDAVQPSSILTSDFGSSHIGNHAKLVTQAVRRFKTLVRTNQSILWLVNQMRTNITTMGARGHKTTGGDAIDFYSKINIEMSKAKTASQLIGTDYIPLRLRVHRSKLGTGYSDVDTYAIQGLGIDQGAELVDLAEEVGLIEKSGSWYKEGENTIGQGIESARSWALKHKEEIMEKLHGIKNGDVEGMAETDTGGGKD